MRDPPIEPGLYGTFLVRFGPYLLLAAAGTALFVLWQKSPLIAGAAVCVAVILVFVAREPEWGTLAAVFVIYSNAAVAAVQAHSPGRDPAAANTGGQLIVLTILSALLLPPAWDFIVHRREPILLDPPVGTMALLLTTMLASSVFAPHKDMAATRIGDFVLEGILLFLLITNVIRSVTTLKRVIAAVVAASAMMAGLTVFQELTGTQDRTYWGLAQRGAIAEAGATDAKQEPRAAGPIGEENRYAQVLVVILPFALFFYRRGISRLGRITALTVAGIIVAGIVLTFSRGGFLTMMTVLASLAALHYMRPRYALACLTVAAVLVIMLLPYYVHRMSSLPRVRSAVLMGDSGVTTDRSAALRITENLACWRAFVDHPLVGLGPGQFGKFYSKQYGNQVGIVRQTRTYRGHNLYLELMAELGIVGIACFVWLVMNLSSSLWMLRRRLKLINDESADLAGAVFLAFIAYLVSGVFLHMSYIRYFWLLAAMAAATIRLLRAPVGLPSSPVATAEHP